MMPLKQCPHCGSTEGMYSKYTLYGMRIGRSFDGRIFTDEDYSWRHGGKKLYCYSCNRYICTVEEWESQRKMLVETILDAAGY